MTELDKTTIADDVSQLEAMCERLRDRRRRCCRCDAVLSDRRRFVATFPQLLRPPRRRIPVTTHHVVGAGR